MRTARVKSRFWLAVDRFLQSRTREQKVLAARWVNAWDKLKSDTPRPELKNQTQRFE